MAHVVLKLDDDVSPDAIYPGRFMATVLPAETPQFAFADLTEFNAKLKQKAIPPGSIIVAGRNFGCGSSREQAATTLKGHDLVVVARGIARIFLPNSINLGLRTVVCPTIEASEGDELDVLPDQVVNRTTGQRFATEALPAARQGIIDAGGLIPYARKKHSSKWTLTLWRGVVERELPFNSDIQQIVADRAFQKLRDFRKNLEAFECGKNPPIPWNDPNLWEPHFVHICERVIFVKRHNQAIRYKRKYKGDYEKDIKKAKEGDLDCLSRIIKWDRGPEK